MKIERFKRKIFFAFYFGIGSAFACDASHGSTKKDVVSPQLIFDGFSRLLYKGKESGGAYSRILYDPIKKEYLYDRFAVDSGGSNLGFKKIHSVSNEQLQVLEFETNDLIDEENLRTLHGKNLGSSFAVETYDKTLITKKEGSKSSKPGSAERAGEVSRNPFFGPWKSPKEPSEGSGWTDGKKLAKLFPFSLLGLWMQKSPEGIKPSGDAFSVVSVFEDRGDLNSGSCRVVRAEALNQLPAFRTECSFELDEKGKQSVKYIFWLTQFGEILAVQSTDENRWELVSCWEDLPPPIQTDKVKKWIAMELGGNFPKGENNMFSRSKRRLQEQEISPTDKFHSIPPGQGLMLKSGEKKK